jgi:threonine synthase
MPILMHEFEKTGALKVEKTIWDNIRKDFVSYSFDDTQTQAKIKEVFEKTEEVLDPHTAIGVAAADAFIKSEDYQGELVIALATAHPAKFPEAVIAAGAPKPKLPHFLEDLLDRKEEFEVLSNDTDVVKKFISERI